MQIIVALGGRGGSGRGCAGWVEQGGDWQGPPNTFDERQSLGKAPEITLEEIKSSYG